MVQFSFVFTSWNSNDPHFVVMVVFPDTVHLDKFKNCQLQISLRFTPKLCHMKVAAVRGAQSQKFSNFVAQPPSFVRSILTVYEFLADVATATPPKNQCQLMQAM